MTITRLRTTACVMTFLLFVAFPSARAQTNVSPAEARAIAEDVYIYGYQLRLYWLNEKAPSILNGSWMPPPVRAVK